jgi:DNA (cytosine-5)-methyltransferase 1
VGRKLGDAGDVGGEGMTHGSLFSGIGGFDLASEWMGWENLFHCEWNDFGQTVLKHYWPKAHTYHDITKSDFTIWNGRIDVLTGGFPCQPYSQAGKRLGKEDDRHLWPEMLRAIREIQPRWVVGENVLGLVNWNGGLVFDEVQADLEAQGYQVQPYVLPACAVNAPHRRDRVWFVAYAMRGGHRGQPETTRPNNSEKRKVCSDIRQHGNGVRGEAERCGEVAPNTDNAGTINAMQDNGNGAENDKGWQGKSQSKSRPFCGDAPDTDGIGLERWRNEDGRQREVPGQYASALCESVGRTGFQNFPTESPICGRNDGLPTELDGITFSKWRQESVKAYGNAIVPQVAYQIFKSIQAYEDSL